MRRFASAVSVGMCLSLTLTGCTSSGVGGSWGSGSGDSLGIGSSIGDALDAAFMGLVATGLIVYASREQVRNERAMRPKVVLSAPKEAAVNMPFRVEAAYRERGKAAVEWWSGNPCKAALRPEAGGAEVKPESEERPGDGKLILTFRSAGPGNIVVEVKTWSAGADTATQKPRAAATRKVKVR